MQPKSHLYHIALFLSFVQRFAYSERHDASASISDSVASLIISREGVATPWLQKTP